MTGRLRSRDETVHEKEIDMPRPTWTGMLSFGLVNIPVGMYTATESNDVSFHMIHGEDGGTIKQQRVCTRCGQVVAFGDLVRGYEYEKGKHITLTDEDFKSVRAEATSAIEITDFVDPTDIDPIYFETPYYLAPDKKSGKAFALLREALRDSKKIAIAKIVMRTREHLCAVRVSGDSLMLETMRYADEIRSTDELPKGEAEVGERELKMAEMLIETMTSAFDPSKYKDTYSEGLNEIIQKKLQGEEITAAAPEREATDVIDLLAHLKASIEQSERVKKEAA
jgi:DNA end-binding protein Ku